MEDFMVPARFAIFAVPHYGTGMVSSAHCCADDTNLSQTQICVAVVSPLITRTLPTLFLLHPHFRKKAIMIRSTKISKNRSLHELSLANPNNSNLDEKEPLSRCALEYTSYILFELTIAASRPPLT